MTHCKFCFSSISHLLVECNRELDDHHPHTGRLPSSNSYVLLPQKFFLLGSLIYHCLYSSVSVRYINWGQYHHLQCLHKSNIFIILFGATEFFLLATMYYDHYEAICKPLHYTTIMNNRVCTLFVPSCWVSSLITTVPPLAWVSNWNSVIPMPSIILDAIQVPS